MTRAVALTIAGALAAVGAWAGETVTSTPLAVTVDGVVDEWEGVPVAYLEESVRVASVAHDAEHVYLTWRFSDEWLARRVLRLGVTAWVDGDGKKRTDVGVRYCGSEALAEALPPRRPDGSDDPGAGAPVEGGPPLGMVAIRTPPGMLTVVSPEGERELPEGGEDGWAAASSVVEGVFTYEVRIPLAAVGGRFAERGGAEERELRLGLEIGGLTEEEQDRLRDEIRSRREGGGFQGAFGGRGRPGGGMAGSGRGGRADVRRSLEGETTWLRVTLPPVAP